MGPNAIPLYSLYALFWCTAIVLVALAGKQINFNTYQHDNLYVPIVQELLITGAMGIIWIPVTVTTILVGSGITSWFSFEVVGALWLWIQYLVGAAYYTGHEFKNRGDCGADVSNEECNISTALLAFSWIGWSLLTFICAVSLLRVRVGRKVFAAAV